MIKSSHPIKLNPVIQLSNSLMINIYIYIIQKYLNILGFTILIPSSHHHHHPTPSRGAQSSSAGAAAPWHVVVGVAAAASEEDSSWRQRCSDAWRRQRAALGHGMSWEVMVVWGKTTWESNYSTLW